LTTLAPEDEGNDHRWPQVLPGGRSALSSVGTGPEEDARIVVHDLRTNARKELLRGSASARYVPTGHLVYARGAELMAMPFDLDRLEVTGSAVRIAEGVAEENDGAPEYSFSSAGDLVYVPGHSGGPRRRLVFVNLQGQVDPIDLPPSVFSAPRVSPDGQQIAVMVQGAKNNTWIYDVTRGAFTRVTFGRYQFPVWTPDGRLTLGRGGPGKTHLVVRAADGAGGDETLTPLARDGDLPGSWSPDGPTLVFLRSSPAGDSDLWTLTPGQDPAPFLSTRYNENNGRYSPDGRLMAYASDETGRFEIYLRDIPGDTRRQVSTTGAANAVWSRDGRRLYYRSPPFPAVQGTLWAVDVDTRPALAVSKPRQLFPTAGFGQYFDIMPDGQRFVMVQLDATPPPKQLNLVLNWFQQPASAESR
jgi:hypothetical protein